MKKSISKLFFIILILFIILIGCSKNNQNEKNNRSSTDIDLSEDTSLNSFDEEQQLTGEEINNLITKLESVDLKIKNKTIKKPEYTISKDYQKEPMKFNSLVIEDKLKNNDIAVIGTNNVKLYNNIKGQEVILEIPKGEIIPIYKVYKNQNITTDPDGAMIDSFQFGNEYNYWYETEFKGKHGFVFGSYIVNNEETYRIAAGDPMYRFNYEEPIKNKLLKLSYFYKRGDKAQNFYKFNGSKNISEESIKLLEKNKFSLEKTNFGKDYDLDRFNADDMIALYKSMHEDLATSTFITTDFFIHNLHLLFDRMLQSTESEILLPILNEFTIKCIAALNEYETKTNADEMVLKNSIELMKKYFIVAEKLINNESNAEGENQIPDDAAKEIELINKAEGFAESPILKYKEDYSQFKPRGHYTKSESLKKYFKAMIWLGRLHFYCDIQNPENREKSLRLTPAALLLTKIVKENNDILTLWKALYEPITYLIGASDDYNFYQFIDASNNVDFNNFGKWLEDKNNIELFIKYANKTIKSPAISGNSLDQNNDGFVDSNTPAGFRVLGQRFTLDSFITTMLSSPRICPTPPNRPMVKGLDVMASFGSTTAEKLVQIDKDKCSGYKENLLKLQKTINKLSDLDFRNTFYNSYLKIIKDTANFDNTMPFYFTQNETWNKKSLLTAHAGWAELRHDTILYVKQSYGELAGKGPGKTWVIDKIKRPIGYIEPNLGALYWMQSILEDSVEMLSKNGFMSKSYQYKFEEYLTIINNAVILAEKEALDKPISEEENNYIYSIPNKLVNIVLPETSGSGYIEQSDLQMALVADVHTDGDHQEVLEVATGMPYRIYVALNDGQGGKRIAEGYTYSYYEFHQPMSDRLNDNQWKQKVYNKENIDDKRPDWINEIVVK